MKVLVQETEGEGFESLMGQNVEIQTGIYIYAGKLVGVNNTCIKLENAHTVFETGEFTSKKYKDAQKRAEPLYIQVCNIITFNKTTML
jgi:hypothetical protein